MPAQTYTINKNNFIELKI